VYNETLVRLDEQPDTADAVESGYGGIEYGDFTSTPCSVLWLRHNRILATKNF
jgi:hypothetical protein